jgi:hypothetical protein
VSGVAPDQWVGRLPWRTVSSHTRTLDQVARLADETVLDALFIIRRKRWHWTMVGVGMALGILAGAALGERLGNGTAFFAASGAIVGGGLGMNIGTDFRFIARTPSRILLLDSSRVSAHPTRVVKPVAPERVSYEPALVSANLSIDGEAHVMARQHITRLDRMLIG